MFSQSTNTDDSTLKSDALHQAGSQAPSNSHVERLGNILLTYNFYDKELGASNAISTII